MFWKKVNRGLLLGAALLVVLVVVIVVGEVRFKQETPLIKERGEAYLADLCKLQCDLQGEIGKPLTAQQLSVQKDKMNQLLNTHWYGDLPDDDYKGTGVNGVRTAYDEYLGQKVTLLISSAELHVREDQTEVKKDGPNRAILRIVADVNLECVGNGSDFFYGSSYGAYYYDYGYGYEDYDPYGEFEPAFDDAAHSGVFFLRMSFELERVGGEWKIVGVSGDGNFNETYDMTEKEGQ